MKLEEILLEYKKVTGSSALALDSTGICHLRVGDTLQVSLENALDGKGFFLFSILATLSPQNEASTLLMAMNGNLFGRETGRATLGYDSINKVLVLSEYFEEHTTDFYSFIERFNHFNGYAIYWSTKLHPT